MTVCISAESEVAVKQCPSPDFCFSAFDREQMREVRWLSAIVRSKDGSKLFEIEKKMSITRGQCPPRAVFARSQPRDERWDICLGICLFLDIRPPLSVSSGLQGRMGLCQPWRVYGPMRATELGWVSRTGEVQCPRTEMSFTSYASHASHAGPPHLSCCKTL